MAVILESHLRKPYEERVTTLHQNETNIPRNTPLYQNPSLPNNSTARPAQKQIAIFPSTPTLEAF